MSTTHSVNNEGGVIEGFRFTSHVQHQPTAHLPIHRKVIYSIDRRQTEMGDVHSISTPFSNSGMGCGPAVYTDRTKWVVEVPSASQCV